MASRLDRLLVLLDTGSTAVVRSAAAKQLGDIQNSHPQELQTLLQKVYAYLKSKTWESRIAAGEAISAIIQHVPLSSPVDEESNGYLSFDSFSLNDVMTQGKPLLGSAGTEFDSLPPEELAGSQKQRLSKELGLTLGNVNLSEGLFNDEDLMPATPPVIKCEDVKQSVEALLNGNESLSARERNKAKRKVKQISRQNSLNVRESVKRQKTMEEEWTDPEGDEWPLLTLAQLLLEDVVSTEWETRHGAAIGLRSILLKHRHTTPWLVDVSLRLITVLALDRFGDYVSHEVVAPVRETTAQVLGIISSHLPHLDALQHFFLQLLQCDEWQGRHGGLLAIKYLLAARQDISPEFLTQLIPYTIRSISDEDDDVRAVAASALLPVAGSLPSKVPEDLLFSLTDKLWTSLTVLDDLSASTSSVISLLSELLKHHNMSIYYNSGKSGTELDVLTPRLRPYLTHTNRTVRKDSLLALKVLFEIKGEWIDKIGPLFARVLYQRIFLESENLFHALILKVWDSLFSGMSESTTNRILTDHLPLWFHLLGAPPGLQLEATLFFKPPPAAVLSIPMGVREFVVKCCMFKALGSAAKLTETDLYFPHILTFIDSGCAAYKLGACFILFELIDQCKLRKDCIQNITTKISSLLTTPLAFDELLASHQNLQMACRGLLMVAKNTKAFESFSALPSFTVESAEALVSHWRQSNPDTVESDAVEAVAESLKTSSVVLSTRVYSALAGCVVRLDELPGKLNPVIKPIMDTLKRESSEELQKFAAESLKHLITLVRNRTPCPIPKIVRNLISGLLEDKVIYPNVETTENPYMLYTASSGEVPSTPTTPMTPGSGDLAMASLSSLTPSLGMISYITTQPAFTPKTSKGRSSRNKEHVCSPQDYTQRGCGIALNCLARGFGEQLCDVIDVLRSDVFEVVVGRGEGDDNSREDNNKVISGLYVLDHLYPSLDPSLQKQLVLSRLQDIGRLLTDSCTAARHAGARLITTLGKHDTVEVMNFLLSHSLNQLDSSETHHRQGITECLFLIVKKLGLAIVPYVVLLVVPTLRRMGDPIPDIRSLATLTFASLVRLMPLDGAKSNVPGLLPELADEKVKQKNFLEELMNPSLIKDCAIPCTINAKLRKYQQEGVNWLWFLCQFGLHGILCDDMGLGKTLQTLCIISTAHAKRLETLPDEKTLPSLVVCPPTLIGHWFYETEKFVSPDDLAPLMYNGSSAERLLLQRVVRTREHNLVICSYDVLRNDAEFFSGIKWNYCVLDEGHVIKNIKTKVSQAIRGVHALHRLILSGTPIQNNVLELWGLFDWLMPGFLGSERQFNDTYSKPINMSRDAKSSDKDQEAGALAMESLHRQVLPFLLRRMKEDVLSDLPPKIIQDYYCTLAPLQKELYDKYAETVESADLKSESQMHVFQSLQFLRKICNHPILMLPKTHEYYPKLESSDSITYSGKLMALNQILADCGIGSQVVSPHRALVFCQLRSMLDVIERHLLKQHLPNVSYLRLDGSTPAVDRVPLVNKFNSDPSYDLLLLTTSVGGLGLNLTGADTVIFVEHDWNPSKDLQAMDRAHRIGQKRVVNVYRLITKDTLEERIMGLQKFKMNIANTVISTENASLQQMGNSGLIDMFNDDKTKDKDDKKSDKSKKGLSAVLEGLGDLWEDEEYEREYDIQSFIDSLHSTNDVKST